MANETPGAEGFRRRLSKADINALPLLRYCGPVRVVDDEGDAAAAARVLSRDEVLGFDTETRPTFRKGQSHPPALLQLAGREIVVLVVLREGRVPTPFVSLLEHAGTLKAGVAMADDMRELQAHTPFEPGGVADLTTLARRARIPTQGLRSMAANLLGIRIAKGAQRSNWARRPLTRSQITYAATDAWIGRELYLALVRHGLAGGC